ncbi:MAG: hypothetical protein IJ149_08230 [Oscillospiraceae bacterium]|nr:hypothetical protein [Oscillospiraceae bacterium]
MKFDAFTKVIIGVVFGAVVITVILSNMGLIGIKHEAAVLREKPVKAEIVVFTDDIDTSDSLSAAYRFYCADTDSYYTCVEDALADAGDENAAVCDAWLLANTDCAYDPSSAYPWFCERVGKYFTCEEDAIAAAEAAGGSRDDVSLAGVQVTTSSGASVVYPWKNLSTGRFYMTKADAAAASGGDEGMVTLAYENYCTDSADEAHPWFNTASGKYYATEAAANAAGDGVTFLCGESF